jgi:hypothetical protein
VQYCQFEHRSPPFFVRRRKCSASFYNFS